MSDGASSCGGRDVRRHGVQLVCPCYIEVRNWLNAYYSARAYSRETTGERITAGEKKGAGLALANVICWLATLNDADHERIQADGTAVRVELDKLPASYGKTAGRVDAITVVRRTASALASADAPADSVVIKAEDGTEEARSPLAADDVKALGVVRHPTGHRPKRKDRSGNPDGLKGAVR